MTELSAWLLEQHGVEVSTATVCRVLAKIREAAPPPPPPPALEPATPDDELKIIRDLANAEMKGEEWKQRVAGAHLLMKVRAEERADRAARQPPGPTGQPAADPPIQGASFYTKTPSLPS